MFSHFVALLPLAAFAAVVVATPSNTCDSGSTFCCNQEFKNPAEFKKVVGPDNLIQVLAGLGVNAGLQCTPITVIGALNNGGQCTKQTACCKGVEQVGLVNAECVPIAVPV